MILGITGSRSFQATPTFNKRLVRNCFESALNTLKPDAIIHGGAVGPDKWAHEWATGNGIPSRVMLPEVKQAWAYLARNRAIVLASDAMLVCWDEVSGGTGYTYDFAFANDIPCFAMPIWTHSLDSNVADNVRRYRSEWLETLS